MINFTNFKSNHISFAQHFSYPTTWQALIRISTIVASINAYIAHLLRLVRALTLAISNPGAERRLGRLDRIASGSSLFDSVAVEEL